MKVPTLIGFTALGNSKSSDYDVIFASDTHAMSMIRINGADL